MTKKDARKEQLQVLCREYLYKLKYMAKKHGLGAWINDLIRDNKRNKCEATEKEVVMLSRLVDDERLSRTDIPNIMGKSYRQCNDEGIFDKIKKLKHVGIYEKVSALLMANK